MNPIPASNQSQPQEIFQEVRKFAEAAWEFVKKVATFALTVFLAGVFPGSFVLGTTMGLIVGVFMPADRLKESIQTIGKIWDRQPWLFFLGATLYLSVLGLPYAVYLASGLRGGTLGLAEALKAKE